MNPRYVKTIAAVLAIPILSACGGSDDPAPPAATQTAIGTISGFGSVIVNGIRFDDSAASVSMMMR